MKRIKQTFLSLNILISLTLSAQRNYTAGEIQSKATVQYGRFELKMYSSDVSGTTSTFFMWKDKGTEANVRWNELDIETFGKNPTSWQSNPIWEYNGSDQVIKRWEQIHNGLKIANNWVTFVIEWTPNYIAWFNNGIQVRRINKGENVPADHFRYNGGNSRDPVGSIGDPMRMCFNHWATFPGDWLGPFNAADLPSYQFVDWITYQKWNGNGFDPVSIRHDFNSIAEVNANYNISTHTFAENQCQFSTKAVGVVNGFLRLGVFKNGQERTPTTEVPSGVIISPIIYNHVLPKKIEAEQFNKQYGLQLEPVIASEGTGQDLAYTDANDYAEYGIEVPNTGNYIVDFRVSSLAGNGGLALQVDGQSVINDLPVPSTGGWQNWVTLSRTIQLTAGKHTLRFVVSRAGFNLNWMNFTRDASLDDTDGDGYTNLKESSSGRNPNTASDLKFDFSTTTDGWARGGTISAECVGCGNSWLVKSDGNDPNITRNGLNFKGNEVKGIKASISSEVAGTFQLFWTTTSDPNFGENKSVTISYPVANVGQDLYFILAGNPLWSNQTITNLRLDPPGASGHTSFRSIEAFNGTVTGYEPEIEVEKMTVSPNPSADGMFNLSKPTSWKVYSLFGKELKTGTSNTINLSDYPKGVYLMKMNNRMERLVIE